MSYRTTVFIFFWTFTGFVISLSFNNCAEQRFSSDKTRWASQLSEAGKITINNDDDFTQSKDVTLNISADGSSEMYLTNDPTCSSGGEWQKLISQMPWTLSKENVSVSVYVKFRNQAKIESNCINDSIVHDNQGPEIEFKRTPDLVTSNKMAQFSIFAADSLSGIQQVECSGINGLGFRPCSSLVAENVSQQGNLFFKIRARDKAGNVSEIKTYSWLTDWTPPTIQWNQTPAAVSGSSEASLKFSASDDLSGIKDIICLHPLTHQEMSCSSGELTLSSLSDNSYQIKIKSIDRAGNSSEWKEYQWRVDLTAPVVSLLSTPKPFEKTTQAHFDFEGNDGGQPVKKFQCRVDNGNREDCVSGINIQVMEGPHHFEVMATDEVGNVSSPASYNWLVDQQAPVVQWVNVPGLYSNDANPRLIFSATDPGNSGIYKLDCSLNGTAIDCSNSVIAPVNLVDGRYTVSVIATDQANNTSSPLTYIWNIDRVAPTIQFVKTPALVTSLQTDHFEFIGQDNSSPILGYQCKLDGETPVTCNTPYEVKNLTPGPHRFEVLAIDAANNLSQPITYNWTVDVMGPNIVILERPVDHAYGSEDTIHFKVTDDYSQLGSIQCGFEGHLQACKSEETINLGILSQGTYKFLITATDSLGNGTLPAEITWNVQLNLDPQIQNLSITSLSKSIDILFVVDNSSSMSAEQLEIKNRIKGFIDKIQNIDWQIGVTSTDPSKSSSWGDGQLRIFGNYKQILTPQDSNLDTQLGNAVYMGTNGSGDERGINATYRVIQRALSDTTSGQAKLIRKDAALSVVLISDEDECSNGCSSSLISSSPQGLLSLVTNELGADKRFAFHSIIWRPGTVCSTGYNQGHTYAQLTQLTQGILGDVCATSYANQLSGIGDSVNELVTSVQLNCAPVDGNNDGQVDLNIYSVASNGTKTPFNSLDNPYTITGRLVKFTYALHAGNYEFDYNCLK